MTLLSIFTLVLFSSWSLYLASQNNALNFDGVNDYVIAPDLYSDLIGISRTIEIWFYAESAGITYTEQDSTGLNINWYDSQMEVLNTREVIASEWVHRNFLSGYPWISMSILIKQF